MKLIDIDRAIIEGIKLYRQRHYSHLREEPTRSPVFQGGGVVPTAMHPLTGYLYGEREPTRMVENVGIPRCGTGSLRYVPLSAGGELDGLPKQAGTASYD